MRQEQILMPKPPEEPEKPKENIVQVEIVEPTRTVQEELEEELLKERAGEIELEKIKKGKEEQLERLRNLESGLLVLMEKYVSLSKIVKEFGDDLNYELKLLRKEMNDSGTPQMHQNERLVAIRKKLEPGTTSTELG